MKWSDVEIRQRLRLGEDGGWEFKRIEFAGDRPASPRREDLADEMAAFANANGGGASLRCVRRRAASADVPEEDGRA